MSLISVIVPVYRAATYIERCVNSLLSQTVTDLDVILVDDASPDESGAICDKLAKADVRITVIHKIQNEGAAAARNTGLERATGTYVTFCDSDDMVAPTWLEHLLDYANETTLSLCSYCRTEQELGCPKVLPVASGDCLPTAEYYTFNQIGIAGFLWNALYCNRVIQENGLRLRCQREKGDYNEDLLFALSYVRHIQKIVYTGYADYWYDTRENSLSTSPQARALYFEKYDEKYRLWKSFLQDMNRQDQLEHLATVMLYHVLTSLDYRDFKRFRRIVLSESTQEIVKAADPSSENPQVLKYIRKKAVIRLWLLYVLHSLRG